MALELPIYLKIFINQRLYHELAHLLRRLEFSEQPKVKLSLLLRKQAPANSSQRVLGAHPFSLNSNMISAQVGTQIFLASPKSTWMNKVYLFFFFFTFSQSQMRPLLFFHLSNLSSNFHFSSGRAERRKCVKLDTFL